MKRYALVILAMAALPPQLPADEGEHPRAIDYPHYPPAPVTQEQAEADRKSASSRGDRL